MAKSIASAEHTYRSEIVDENATCLHCGKPVAANKSFCCGGCETVYHMENTSEAAAKTCCVPNEDKTISRYTPFVTTNDDTGTHQLTLLVDGIHCASCIKLIESGLTEEPHVTYARVNMSTNRLVVEWQGEASFADALAAKVESLGYKTHAFDPDSMKASGHEQQNFLLRCIAISGFAMGNLMLFSVALWSTEQDIMGIATRDFMHLVGALIAIPTVLYAGQPFFRSALEVLKEKRTNMDVPISLALILATGMSIAETLRHGEHVYFDSAVMLLFFLLIGRYLDARARNKVRESAEQLLSMMGGVATIMEGSKQRSIPIRDIQAGMTVLVAVGEKIPTDSIITQGQSDIDTSLITGETLPCTVREGEEVYGGTLNLSAPLTLMVSRASEESLLSDIVRLMEKAEQGQARYVRLADRAAQLYIPVVHSMGALTFLGWWLFMGLEWQTSLLHGITVLIITCPCALGLAVPVVQVLASNILLKRGILPKSGDALERLASIDTAVFDKTGTLTLGTPVLESVVTQETTSPLKLAASIARHSRHPLSQAIIESYGEELIENIEVKEISGMGLEATYNGHNYKLGRRSWCGDKSTNDQHTAMELWLAKDDLPAAQFTFSDILRPDAVEVIASLQAKGIDVHLLSGDRKAVADHIAGQLGITHVQAELTPVEKCDIIKQMRDAGKHVLMVGDGLNDAPSLASATVSMSPASGMDITQNTADIVFQGKVLSPVTQALDTAKYSTLLVKQNFALAFLYNVIAIPLAVMGYVTPLIAAIAMSGSSIAVILNAFRLPLHTRQ